MSFELESAFQCLLTASEEDFAETARQLGKDEQRKLLHRLLDASLPPDSEQPAGKTGKTGRGAGARKRSKSRGKMGDRKSDDPDSQPGKGSEPKGSQTDSQPGKGSEPSQTDSQPGQGSQPDKPWSWSSQPYYSQSWWWSQTGSQHSEQVSQDGLIHIKPWQRTGGRGILNMSPARKSTSALLHASLAARRHAIRGWTVRQMATGRTFAVGASRLGRRTR